MNIPKIDKARLLAGLKGFFTKNLALKIIAFVFAMLLWGYVLTDQKPMREKEVTNVSTSFDGEAELIAQGYCVRGDRSEILEDVTVNVLGVGRAANETGASAAELLHLSTDLQSRSHDLERSVHDFVGRLRA